MPARGLDAFLAPAAARADPVPAGPIALDLRDADVRLYTNQWSPKECAEIVAELAALPDWAQRAIKVCNRDCLQNRRTAFYARNRNLNYRYSGVDNSNAPPFPPVVERICKRVSGMLEFEFNYCLLNLYQDGRDKIGWHPDDERDLHPGAPIVSCSFGAARFFDFRRKDDHADKLRTNLESGSIVVMGRGTQRHYHHQVPSQLKITEPRYNLTFRVVLPPVGDAV